MPDTLVLFMRAEPVGGVRQQYQRQLATRYEHFLGHHPGRHRVTRMHQDSIPDILVAKDGCATESSTQRQVCVTFIR
ncbi:hypothetical protein [Rubrivivax albus]|uniref:Uncharacterized protein n=1 Tax=Rubrivivax albus TaxID=2499835 RepID=A0A437JRQ9_9BURK|nr:hypothetical protein [Rubrivivax albus]RVT49597.1 hypothetical protein ENE75_18250 [Rubrivivax albus]